MESKEQSNNEVESQEEDFAGGWWQRSAQMVKGSPVLFASGAFAAGALAAMLIPNSKVEQRYVIEPAQKLFGRAKNAFLKGSREFLAQNP